jgi:hypothetical protein
VGSQASLPAQHAQDAHDTQKGGLTAQIIEEATTEEPFSFEQQWWPAAVPDTFGARRSPACVLC